jgi:hypothetical protein
MWNNEEGNMKYPYRIKICTVFICFLILAFSFSQPVQATSNDLDSIPKPEKHILLGIGAGYRLNIDSKPDLNSNGFWGFSVDIPITYNLSISSGLVFWNSSSNDGLIVRDYSVVDIPLLLTYTTDMAGKGLDIFIGTGLLTVSEKSDDLIALNAGTSFWYSLSQTFRLTFSIKLQKAGSLQAGGGDTITSIYLGGGVKIQIN